MSEHQSGRGQANAAQPGLDVATKAVRQGLGVAHTDITHAQSASHWAAVGCVVVCSVQLLNQPTAAVVQQQCIGCEQYKLGRQQLNLIHQLLPVHVD
jgi:hypothetical protein